MVWSTYWVDGHFTTSLLKVKLRQAIAAFRGNEGQAVLVLSTQMEATPQVARDRLSNVLAGLGRLPENLNSANHPAPTSGSR
jgi:hypothetical protein